MEATLTHVRGKGKAQNGGSNSQDNEESEDETGGNAKLYDLTMQMLPHLGQAFGLQRDSGAGGDPGYANKSIKPCWTRRVYVTTL